MKRLDMHDGEIAGPQADFFVHVDDELIVVNKPAGLPSVPGRTPELQDCAWRRAVLLHPDARVVHRLDMATSGLLLFTRGPAAQRIVAGQFERRQVEKTYVALVDGRMSPDEGTIEARLRTDWPNRPRQIIDPQAGKPATTHWQVVARADSHTRLHVRPVTGRSHQIRVHLLSIGHPILGDTLYGGEGVADATPRLCLHACGLALTHPGTGQRIAWSSSAPF